MSAQYLARGGTSTRAVYTLVSAFRCRPHDRLVSIFLTARVIITRATHITTGNSAGDIISPRKECFQPSLRRLERSRRCSRMLLPHSLGPPPTRKGLFLSTPIKMTTLRQILLFFRRGPVMKTCGWPSPARCWFLCIDRHDATNHFVFHQIRLRSFFELITYFNYAGVVYVTRNLTGIFRVHDCFDDGETGASSKMLELLEKMDASNVLVCSLS